MVRLLLNQITKIRIHRILALFGSLSVAFGPIKYQKLRNSWRNGSWNVNLLCHLVCTMHRLITAVYCRFTAEQLT